MIGNLFSAVSIAIFSGVLALGGVNADSLNTARLDGLQVPVEEVGSMLSDTDVYSPLIEFSSWEEFDIPVENVVDYTYNSVYVYGYNVSRRITSIYDGTYETLQQCFPYGEDSFVCAIGISSSITGVGSYRTLLVEYQFLTKSSVLSWGGNNYVIDGLEFSPYSVAYDSDGAVLSSSFGSFHVDDLDLTIGNSYGVISSQVYGVETNFFMFPQVFKSSIRLSLLPSDTTKIRLGFSGQWCCNYFNTRGYAQGFADGSSSGWSQGYLAGLNHAQGSNGTFMGLFNSIADTPLRFIYGLFNFDLFGISCLVIILTLLTGVMVFGLFKKVWK